MPRRKNHEEQVRLHVTLPKSQYDQIVAITGIGTDTFHGRGYGKISYIIRLALGYYFNQVAPQKPITFQEESLHELAKL